MTYSGFGRKLKNDGEFFDKRYNEVTLLDREQYDLGESENHKTFPLAVQIYPKTDINISPRISIMSIIVQFPQFSENVGPNIWDIQPYGTPVEKHF